MNAPVYPDATYVGLDLIDDQVAGGASGEWRYQCRACRGFFSVAIDSRTPSYCHCGDETRQARMPQPRAVSNTVEAQRRAAIGPLRFMLGRQA